ncbi:hypothetical protein J7L13_03150 [bacterium]|nr:hypothetical protein [bacterium]
MLNIKAILESKRWRYPYGLQKNFIVPRDSIVGFYIKCKDVSLLEEMTKPLDPEKAEDKDLASKISYYTDLAFHEPKPSAMALKMAEWNMNKAHIMTEETRKITFINGFIATYNTYFNYKVRGFNGLIFVVKTNASIDTGATGELIANHMNYVGKVGIFNKLLSELWKAFFIPIIGYFMMDTNYDYIDEFYYKGAVRLGSIEDFSVKEDGEAGGHGKRSDGEKTRTIKAGFTLDSAIPLIILSIIGGLIWKRKFSQ